MRRILCLIMLFLAAVFNVAEAQNVVSVKPVKDYVWGISEEFHSEPGFAGSYWHTAMRVICDNAKYMLTIYKPANNGYYAIHENEDCYLKMDNDSIIALKLNVVYGPWNYEVAGYYSGRTWMPKRYFTQTFYDIPDIQPLLTNNVVKIRWIIDGKPYDIDYKESNWVKKFNKRLKNAINESTEKFKAKANFKDNNLLGF